MPSEQEPTKQEFRFEALDQNGQTAKGTVRADSDYEAFTKLKQKGLVVSNLSVLEETVAVEKEAVSVGFLTGKIDSSGSSCWLSIDFCNLQLFQRELDDSYASRNSHNFE